VMFEGGRGERLYFYRNGGRAIFVGGLFSFYCARYVFVKSFNIGLCRSAKV
jgi:hypothetical protein